MDLSKHFYFRVIFPLKLKRTSRALQWLQHVLLSFPGEFFHQGIMWVSPSIFVWKYLSSSKFSPCKHKESVQITLEHVGSFCDLVNWEMKRSRANPNTCLHFTATNKLFIYTCAYKSKMWGLEWTAFIF